MSGDYSTHALEAHALEAHALEAHALEAHVGHYGHANGSPVTPQSGPCCTQESRPAGGVSPDRLGPFPSY